MLERLSCSTDEAAWYRLVDETEPCIERYVVSTAHSRRIVNHPELVGVEYTDQMQLGIAAALRTAPFRALLLESPEEELCVLHFLRGGLNFALRQSLHSAYGVNRHGSAFMSSQRACVDGEWLVRDDAYRKLEIPPRAILLVGDVVATGVTLENGFEVMAEHASRSRTSIRSLVLFTIGCVKAEGVLERLHERISGLFPAYERTVLVYLEGRFRLVDSGHELRIGIPGTDLIRKGAQIAPELELSTYDGPAVPLERCAIYDAGSRAFAVSRYAEDLLGYWEALRGLAERGWTLCEALKERWPATEYTDRGTFREAKAQAWGGVSEELLDALFAANERGFGGDEASADALAELCAQRIELFGSMRRPG